MGPLSLCTKTKMLVLDRTLNNFEAYFLVIRVFLAIKVTEIDASVSMSFHFNHYDDVMILIESIIE